MRLQGDPFEHARRGCAAVAERSRQVRIDAAAETITVDLTANEIGRRRADAGTYAARQLGGTLEKYAALVGPANLGAVTHSGAVKWDPDV